MSDLRNVSALMELAAEKTVFRSGKDGMAQEIRQRFQNQLNGWSTIHIWTDTQADGICYAIYHMINVIKTAYDQYYAALECDHAAPGQTGEEA